MKDLSAKQEYGITRMNKCNDNYAKYAGRYSAYKIQQRKDSYISKEFKISLQITYLSMGPSPTVVMQVFNYLLIQYLVTFNCRTLNANLIKSERKQLEELPRS